MTKTGSSLQGFKERMADFGEALAYAEAGELDLAGEAFNRKSGRIIVTVSHNGRWPARLAEYALQLASRLGDTLVLLSLLDGNSPAQTAQAARAADHWVEKAGKEGVAARSVQTVGTGPALTSVVAELGRVDMVLCDENFPDWSPAVPVYWVPACS